LNFKCEVVESVFDFNFMVIVVAKHWN